jgi:ArsR family transcriptional regulator
VPRKPKSLQLHLLFRALADRTRLRLLNLIADREICVCYFVEILGMSQPKISRHLAYLRRAGIVAARRQGRWMHYRLITPVDPAAHSILKKTLLHLREMPDMARDLAKLEAGCCGPGAPQVMGQAPAPTLVPVSALFEQDPRP